MKNQKAVTLATDVLAQLNAGTIAPGDGGYFSRPNNSACRVCATAALAVACCGLDDLIEKSGGSRFDGDQGVVACLRGDFTLEQLALIEAAYEGMVDAPLALRAVQEGLIDDDEYFEDAAMLFHNEDRDPIFPARARLISIMQNIIDNGGEFIP